MHVAVVGAGMAGLSCARALLNRGVLVTVYDKGRTPGGRVATRVAGPYTFDHGTPWFDEPYGLPVERWLAGWVGVPSMADIPRAIVVPDVRSGRHVAFFASGSGGWKIRHLEARGTPPGLIIDKGGIIDGPYDGLVLAIPSPQAAPLLSACAYESVAADVRHATMTPCWTFMAGWEQPGHPDFAPPPGPIGQWAIDSARPGRAPAPLCITAHATTAWSVEHLYDDPAAVQATLASAVMAMTGCDAAPDFAAVQRWRYARTETPLGRPCLDAGRGLVVCGDWCLGPDVGDAIASGQAAAAAIMA